MGFKKKKITGIVQRDIKHGLCVNYVLFINTLLIKFLLEFVKRETSCKVNISSVCKNSR